jgi:ABC-2 type transport system permease protein
MLYQILALTIKDLKILFRDRGGMITLFAMPIMFILVMSVALQGVFEVGGADRPLELLVVNQDKDATYLDGTEGHLGAASLTALQQFDGLKLITDIEGAPLTRARAEALIADGKYRMALILPPDFSQRVVDSVVNPYAATPEVTFILDPGAQMQLVAPVEAAASATLNRTVAYAQAPYRIRAALESAAAKFPPTQRELVAALSQALTKELVNTYDLGDIGGQEEVQIREATPPAFHVEKLPTAVEQNVPGYTVFGVFFIVGVLASSILNEREVGTFRRLMAAPLYRTALLLGKLLPYYMVNLIQVGLMFAIGRLVFGMSLGQAPLALVAITLATAAAATGLGLLVAALGKTERQISGLSTLLSLILAAIGGALVPVFVMPGFMQAVAHLSPHYWALQGYQDVIVRGLGFRAVLPETGALAGFALVFYAIALARFRFD